MPSSSDRFELFRRVRLGVEIALGHGRRLFDEAVFHRPRQRVVHHHVLERHRARVLDSHERVAPPLLSK